MKHHEVARMSAAQMCLHFRNVASGWLNHINVRSRMIYLINILNLTSGQPYTDVQVVRQQNKLGIPKQTTISVEPCSLLLKEAPGHQQLGIYWTLDGLVQD